MPKLWTATIEEHRREVRDAILDTAADLVADRGLRAVTMSEIAEQTGIARATLYKYFPDVDAILVAWHDRKVTVHLEQLTELGELEAVLGAYAMIQHRHDNSDVAALLHRGERVAGAQRRLRTLLRDLISEGAAAGDFRADVPADELAGYCLHALSAARTMTSKAAVQRLVMVTLAGLRS